MTESVSIDSFGSGIKAWASEETSKQILSVLQGYLKKTNKSTVIGAGSGNTKSFKDLEKSLTNTNKNYKTNNKNLAKSNNELDRNAKTVRSSSSAFDKFRSAMLQVPGMILGGLFSAITASRDTQLELYKSGTAFSGSLGSANDKLTSLQGVMQGANLTFGDLTKLTAEYGSTLAREGIGTFTRYSKNLRENFRNVGMTSQESAEWMASYLKGQEKFAYRQKLSEVQQQAAMRSRLDDLNKWSQVLGISKKQIQDSINAEKEKPNVAAFMSTLGPASSAAIESLFAQLGNSPETKAKMSEALADPFVARSKLYTDLASAGATEATLLLEKLHKAVRSAPEDVPALMSQFTKEMGKVDLTQSMVMGESGAALQTMVGELNAVNQALATQGEVVRANVRDHVESKDAQTQMVVALQSIMVTMDKFLPVITRLSETISETINMLHNEVLKPLIESGIVDKLMSMVKEFDPKAIVNSLKNMFESVDGTTVAVVLGGALAAVLLGPAVISAVVSGLSSVISKALGAGGGVAGKGAGKGMEGIAKGLSFFSNPKVLLGGLSLGAIIAAIGAGFAAAIYLTGKSLHAFTDGMREVQSLDGDRLLKVGKGIGEIAKGLALFAGAGIAGALGSISTAFGDLFRDAGDNPLAQLSTFANQAEHISAPLTRLGQALSVFAPSFRDFSEAMSYDNNFDFEKFTKNLKLLGGKQVTTSGMFSDSTENGLSSKDIANFKSNIMQIQEGTAGFAKASKDTNDFATSIENLADALHKLNSVAAGEPQTDVNKIDLATEQQEAQQKANEVAATAAGVAGNPATPGPATEDADKLGALIAIATQQLDELTKLRKAQTAGL